MFSKEELLRKRGSKVSKNDNIIELYPGPDGNMFIICADERYLKCGNGSIRLKKKMVQYGPYVKDLKTSIQGIARRELQIYTNT
jgi:hypothetical protein